MSSSPFPDPRTTNFIPEAWQWIDLWNKFRNFILSYPTAQNATINFQDPVFLTTRTALTQLADTAYATSEIVAWVTANVTPILGSAFTSSVLQYYFGGIRVATINPLTAGGTLAIGNSATTNQVDIMTGSNTGTLTFGASTSTLTLNAPLEPLYSPIFTSGQIGFILPTVFLTNDVSAGGGHTSLRSIVIPADGVYMLNGAMFGTGTSAPFPYPTQFYGYSFSTVGPNPANVDANFILRQVTGIQIQANRATRWSTTFTIAARLTAGTIYFNGRFQFTYTIGSSVVKVMRIA
jgi:hypothetical protein